MFRVDLNLVKMYFSFYRISVYELYCTCPTYKQLTVYTCLPVPGGFGALQARFHQPISGSGEEVRTEGSEKERAAGLQSRPGAGPQGGSIQTKEELHHTGST